MLFPSMENKNLLKIWLPFSALCCSTWCQSIFSITHLTLSFETSDLKENSNEKITPHDKKYMDYFAAQSLILKSLILGSLLGSPL